MLVANRNCVPDITDPSQSCRVLLDDLLMVLTLLTLIQSERMKLPIAPEITHELDCFAIKLPSDQMACS